MDRIKKIEKKNYCLCLSTWVCPRFLLFFPQCYSPLPYKFRAPKKYSSPANLHPFLIRAKIINQQKINTYLALDPAIDDDDSPSPAYTAPTPAPDADFAKMIYKGQSERQSQD